jgi:hypothetical protein
VGLQPGLEEHEEGIGELAGLLEPVAVFGHLGQQVAVHAGVDAQSGIADLLHVDLLVGEMTDRVGDQFAERPGLVGARRAGRVQAVQRVHQADQPLVLAVHLADTEAVLAGIPFEKTVHRDSPARDRAPCDPGRRPRTARLEGDLPLHGHVPAASSRALPGTVLYAGGSFPRSVAWPTARSPSGATVW